MYIWVRELLNLDFYLIQKKIRCLGLKYFRRFDRRFGIYYVMDLGNVLVKKGKYFCKDFISFDIDSFF